MTDFRERFTYRGRDLGELVIPAEALDEAQRARLPLTVTTEVSRWDYWRWRVWAWFHPHA